MMKAYAAKLRGRKAEAPGEHPITQDLLMDLFEAVIEETRRQKVKQYSMPDFPASDPITAIGVGAASGLAATGIHQVYKQLRS